MTMINDNLYDIYLKYSYDELMQLFKNAKSKDEQDFYAVLSNLALKKKAKKYLNL